MAKNSVLMTTKTCSRCKTAKPISDFGRNATTKDKLQYYCKACARGAVKAYLATEQGKANNLRWQAAHRGRVRV
jgi:hypothetical protein